MFRSELKRVDLQKHHCSNCYSSQPTQSTINTSHKYTHCVHWISKFNHYITGMEQFRMKQHIQLHKDSSNCDERCTWNSICTTVFFFTFS